MYITPSSEKGDHFKYFFSYLHLFCTDLNNFWQDDAEGNA